jgi:hypothetical protein
MDPDDLNEISVEELAQDLLHASDKKLEILDEERFCLAIEDFVDKEQRQAISETVHVLIRKQQKALIARGKHGSSSHGSGQHHQQKKDDENDDADMNTNSININEHKVTTAAGVRELCLAETEKKRLHGTGNPLRAWMRPCEAAMRHLVPCALCF